MERLIILSLLLFTFSCSGFKSLKNSRRPASIPDPSHPVVRKELEDKQEKSMKKAAEKLGHYY